MSELLAGAGRAVIRIPDVAFPVDGFTGVHDPLFARVLLLDQAGVRVALVVVDQTSLVADLVDEIQETVSRSGALDQDQVIVSASHTFSAPHIAPRGAGPDPTLPIRGQLLASVDVATRAAVEQLRPARIGIGTGESRVNVNRDVSSADGWWLGANEHGVSDHEVSVGRIDDLDDRPIAVVANYAVQSSIMNESISSGRGRLVTADLAGAAMDRVERRLGAGAVALFLVGAAGDQAPSLTAHRHTLDSAGHPTRVDVGDAGFALLEVLGERLGDEVADVVDRIMPTPMTGPIGIITDTVTVNAQVAPSSFRDLRPSHRYDFTPAGSVDLPLWFLWLGEVAIVGLQPELSATTGLDVKRRSPFPTTMVATMINGAAKYLPDESSYDRITYESMSARYARGAAETVADRITAVLHSAAGEGFTDEPDDDLVIVGRMQERPHTAITEQDPTGMSITSTASVATDRPERYGKQLCSHLSRRSTTAWDEDARTGSIEFSKANAELSCTGHGLTIVLTADPDDLDTMEDVVGRHLVRFGTRDELHVNWRRSDGTPGTEQRRQQDGSAPVGEAQVRPGRAR